MSSARLFTGFLVLTFCCALSRAASGTLSTVSASVETVFVHASLPTYRVTTVFSPDSSTGSPRVVRTITIAPLRDFSASQTVADTCRGENTHEFLDLNFDGYKDLRLDLDSEEPANIGQSSTVYLFNPRANQFSYSRAFSGHSELTVNSIDSTLYTQVLFMGGRGSDHSKYTVEQDTLLRLIGHEHRWGETYVREEERNGEVVVIEREEVDTVYPDGWMLLTRSRLVRDTLLVVSRSVLRRFDGEPTQMQSERSIVIDKAWGRYILRSTVSYKYSLDAGGRPVVEITERRVDGDDWVTVSQTRRRL